MTILAAMAGDELKIEGNEGDPPARRRARWWVGAGVAVVVVAVIVVFAVAQGGGSGGGPLNAIAKAAEVTQREPGGRAKFEAVIDSTTTSEGFTETGSMIFDDSGMARGVVTVKGHSTGKEVKALSISKGTTSYASSEALNLPEGKKWMEVEVNAATSGASSSGATASSPKEGLKLLESVEGAEEVGKEDIGGVPTTHYRGTLPTAEEVFGVKVHVSGLEVDVWIDAQDRVRRMQFEYTTAIPGNEEATTTTDFTIDYVSFGRVPKINLPNPAEVVNATSEVEANVQAASEGG